jgi:pimeloyl-ACP methyl ester carboxylesterase
MTNISRISTPAQRFIDAPTLLIAVRDTQLAYRELGLRGGVPLVMLNHWGADLDNFDPRIVDALASQHHVITVDYRGIGGSGGLAPLTIHDMSRDIMVFIRALGFERVDLMGFSLGGFVAQDVALKAPGMVRSLILAGTGPAGGDGIARVGAVSWPLILKGMLTFRDPKTYLFFTSTAKGRGAAQAFLTRLKERKSGRDKGPSPRAFLRQLTAIHAWGRQAPQNLESLRMPVLVANSDTDIMVPTPNSRDMARRIPGAELVIYPDSGHGGIFQYHTDFTAQALAFLV